MRHLVKLVPLILLDVVLSVCANNCAGWTQFSTVGSRSSGLSFD